MSSLSFIDIINKNIPLNTRINNWSVDNKFKIPYYTYIGIDNHECVLLHPKTNKKIKISETSFQYLYTNWEQYKTGKKLRNEFRQGDRFTTYTICLLKYLEDNKII